MHLYFKIFFGMHGKIKCMTCTTYFDSVFYFQRIFSVIVGNGLTH